MVGLSVEREVRTRAGEACEYCRFPQALHVTPFQIDHIISRQNLGTDEVDNLALACNFCNLHKGPNVGGIDPESGQLVRLFNPRSDDWSEHFVANDNAEVLGVTAIGRVTVLLLAMNSPPRLRVRRVAIRTGLFKL
jgi:hypothetical protein